MSKLQLKHVAVGLLILSASAILWTRLTPRPLAISVPGPPLDAATSSQPVDQTLVVTVNFSLDQETDFIAQHAPDSLRRQINRALTRMVNSDSRIKRIYNRRISTPKPRISSSSEGVMRVHQSLSLSADVRRQTNLLGSIFGMRHCKLRANGHIVLSLDPRGLNPDWTLDPRIDVDPEIRRGKCENIFLGFDADIKKKLQDSADRFARDAAEMITGRLRASMPSIRPAMERTWHQMGSGSLSQLGLPVQPVDVRVEPCRFRAAQPAIRDQVLSVAVGLSFQVASGAEQTLGSMSMCDADVLPPLMIGDLAEGYDLRLPYPIGFRGISDRFRTAIRERLERLAEQGRAGLDIKGIETYPSGQNVVVSLDVRLRRPRATGTLHVLTTPVLDADGWAVRFEDAEFTRESRVVMERIFEDQDAVDIEMLLLAIEGASLALKDELGTEDEVFEIATELVDNAIAAMEEDVEPAQVMRGLGRLHGTGRAARLADIGLERMELLQDAMVLWFTADGQIEFTLR